MSWTVRPGLLSAGRAAVLLAAWGLDLVVVASGVAPLPPALLGLIAVTGLPVVIVLAGRSRNQGLGLVVAWVYCVIWSVAVRSYQPFLVLLVAAYGVFRRGTPGRARVVLVMVAGLFVWYSTQAAADRVQVALIHLVVLLIPWTVAMNARRTEALQLAKHQAETALALQRDRLRLARELHDTVSHAVTAMMWQAAGANAGIATRSTTELSGLLTRIETSGKQALSELHHLLGLLHTSTDSGVLDAGTGLGHLPDLIAAVRSTGLPVDLTEDGRPGAVDPRVDHVAYRVVQEALTNAMKHGGPGVRTEVALSWTAAELRLWVSSRGTDAATGSLVGGGFGLAGLTDRVQSVGGRLTVGATSDRTYDVRVWLPTR